MVMCMLIGLVDNSNSISAEEQDNIFIYKGEKIEVEFRLDESWEQGYQATIEIKNITTKKIKNWGIVFSLENEITSIWNAEIQTKQDTYYTIKNAGWNQNIQPGSSITFSFIAAGEFLNAPEEYRLLSSRKVVDNPDYEVEYSVSDYWAGGFNGSIQIKNQSEKTLYGWSLEFDYAHDIDSIWNAEIASHVEGNYQIDSMDYNQNILPGQSVTFGFNCLESDNSVNLTNIQVYQYVFEEETSQEISTTEPPEETADISTGGGIDGGDNIEDDNKEVEKGEESGDNTGENKEDIERGEIQEGDDSEKEEMEGNDAEIEATNQPDSEEKIEGESSDITEDTEDLTSEEVLEITKENAKDYVYIEYINGNTNESVTDNVFFRNDASEQISVFWKSSNEEVIGNDGVVHRQNQDENVVITAEITVGEEVLTKNFELTVIAQNQWKKTEIEDLNIQQIKEMNEGDEDYECKVNDFGYIQYIYGKYSPVKVDSYESALYSLYSVKTALGITDPLKELQPYDVDVTEAGYIFKFHQVHDGLEVFSNSITISSDFDGNVRTLHSTYYPFLQELDNTPLYNYEQAAELLKEEFGNITILEEDDENQLCIINYYGHIDLVWNFLVESEDASSVLGNEQYRIMVGTKDGEIKYKNKISMSDSIYGVEASGIDMLGDERKFQTKKVIRLQSQKDYIRETIYYLEDTQRKLKVQRKYLFAFYKMHGKDKNNQWEAEDISAMANVEEAYDFYQTSFNRISVNDASTKAKGKAINIRFTGKKNSLMWTKDRIEIGTGDGTDKKDLGFCYKKEELAAGKDTLCHEFTHGVVANETELDNCGYGYPASINEFYADTAACFMDGNWTIGEDITGKINGKKNPLRDNETPENVKCPSEYGGEYFWDVDQMLKDMEEDSSLEEEDIDGGGIHVNCTILTHAVYLMQKAGIRKKHLMKIWYQSLLLGYKKNANFYLVRKNFVEAWKALKKADKKKKESLQMYNDISEKEYLNIINDAFDKVKVTENIGEVTYLDSNSISDKQMYAIEYFDNDINIQGKVCIVDEDGRLGNNEALAGAEVLVLDAENMEVLDGSVSDEVGRYELSPEYRKEYILEFQKEGYLSERMYIHNVNLIVQQDYYCDIVELIPESSGGYGRADGWIFDATNKKPIEGVRLKWRKGINNYDGEVVEDIRTIEDGDYYSGRLEAGNYCVEVIGEKLGYINTYFNVKVIGNTTVDYQYGYISPQIAEGQIRTVLSWGELPADLDSHMKYTLSDGTTGHVYYRNQEDTMNGEKICALDRDDITQFGPETTTIYEGKTGNYQFSVKNYSGECDMGPEGGVVRIYMGGHAYPTYTFCMPEEAVNLWEVYNYNSATGYLQPVNEYS